MNAKDLTVVMGAIKQRESYSCLLTGRPCGLVPVTLRRMVIIPPIVWIGWRAEVILPLANLPSLAFWQYLRLLRPLIVFFVTFFSSVGFKEWLGAEPNRLLARALGFASLSPSRSGSFLAACLRNLNSFDFCGTAMRNKRSRFDFLRQNWPSVRSRFW